MRPIRSLLIYVALVFIGGALLAPWLYFLAQAAASHWRVFAGISRSPFHRYVIRALLAGAVIGLWPLLRHCKMLGRRELGFAGPGRPARRIAAGFAIGFATLAAVALIEIVFGARNFDSSHDAGDLFHLIFNATIAAVLVAILEELIFRGALFGILRKALPWPQALLISSAVYALLHFMDKAEPSGPVQWYSGLALLPPMFRNMGDMSQLFPAVISLLLAGCILALAYQRTGSLYLSIGIHAGWIFWLKSYRFITHPAPGAAQSFWGGDKLIDGWLVAPVLALLLLIIWRRPNTPC